MRTAVLRLVSTVLKVAAIGSATYLILGFAYAGVSLYCYNVRHWDLYGGFSLPPLFFPFGIVFTLTLWPVYLWADWINGIGAFGTCR
ncbi:MAG: hypothetical protein HPY83_07600 [Anaerolineae bacterium]|nr:hypothetical protein [Anaerolineae bacterium]